MGWDIVLSVQDLVFWSPGGRRTIRSSSGTTPPLLTISFDPQSPYRPLSPRFWTPWTLRLWTKNSLISFRIWRATYGSPENFQSQSLLKNLKKTPSFGVFPWCWIWERTFKKSGRVRDLFRRGCPSYCPFDCVTFPCLWVRVLVVGCGFSLVRGGVGWLRVWQCYRTREGLL